MVPRYSSLNRHNITPIAFQAADISQLRITVYCNCLRVLLPLWQVLNWILRGIIMDFDRFSVLLEKAQGNRSGRQFSRDTGVSRTFLSNYINKKYDTRPSIEKLQQIASSCKNGVTYDDLMAACNYMHENIFIPDNINLIKGELTYNDLSRAIAEKVDMRLIDTLTGDMLEEYAKGLDTPTKNEIKILALYVDVDLDFFYRKNTPDDLNAARAIYGSKQNSTKKECSECDLIQALKKADISIKDLINILQDEQHSSTFIHMIDLMKSKVKAKKP